MRNKDHRLILQKTLDCFLYLFSNLSVQCADDYRLTLAKQSLIHTELELEELADALGYRHCSYFITQFTKAVGMTPGEYREKHRIRRDSFGRSIEDKS